MKARNVIWLLFFTITLTAQEKGITPLPAEARSAKAGTTRAVVIGISDYHDPAIPDLSFAHRDAEAFAAWLKSPAGGNLGPDQLRILTNEQATLGNMYRDLDWLVEQSKEGDRAIIYFSGHGDIETKTLRKEGFLLCYNSPPNNYRTSAYAVYWLQDVINQLTLIKKTQVILITDACRAGKLAGQEISGAQLTTAALQEKISNEIKILSCQSNEYSLEGPQWGGGRGVFSYHLTDGLYGLADRNANHQVDLAELARYLDDRVSVEADPLPQNPVVLGNREGILAQVDDAALLAYNAKKQQELPTFSPIEVKGFDELTLASADSSIQETYKAFWAALERKDYMSPAGKSANDFYEILILAPEMEPLKNLLKRNLAAALFDDAQQTLNAILSDNPFEINNWVSNPSKYKQNPRYLQRTMELLGEKHYLYPSLLAKKNYFEGYNLFFNQGARDDQPWVRDSLRREAQKLFLQSLEYEPEAAYTYYSIGSLVEKTGNQAMADTALFWLKKAVELAPTWKQPYVSIAEVFLNWLSKADEASDWLMKAYPMDSTSYLLLQELSWVRQYQHRPEEANAICTKLIELHPELPNAYYTMSHTLFYLQGAVKESEKYLTKAFELENAITPGFLVASASKYCPAFQMMKTRRLVEAIDCLNEGVNGKYLNNDAKSALLSLLARIYLQLKDFDKAAAAIQLTEQICTDQTVLSLIKAEKGRMQLLQGHLSEAEKTLVHALTIDETNDDAWIRIWALLGVVKAAQNKPTAAEEYFKKAVSFWGTNTTNYFQEEAWFLYGQFLLAENRDEDAAHAFEKTEEVYPNGYFAPYGMALLEAKKGHRTVALDWLEKALERYYPTAQAILEEPVFKNIRETKRFKAMMLKNFPKV